MPVTRKFRTTIMDRAVHDPAFRRQMPAQAVNELLVGDLDTGKAMLRDYINATITFQELAKKLKKTDKNVHHMLGSRGNPGPTISSRSLKSSRRTNACNSEWKRIRRRHKGKIKGSRKHR